MRLQGKVALVTGAAGGIGRAVTDLFVKKGAIVFASDVASSDVPHSASVESQDAPRRRIEESGKAPPPDAHGAKTLQVILDRAPEQGPSRQGDARAHSMCESLRPLEA